MRHLLFLCLILFPCCAQAQEPFTRDIWLNESGTPVKANALAFGAGGRMWLAADNGLYTYNGRSIAPAGDSVKAVTALAVQGEEVWYGCRDGSICQRRPHSRSLLLQCRAAVTCLLVTPYGLLAGTEGDGLYYIGGGSTLHYSLRNGLPDDYIYSLYARGSILYFATDKGVCTGGLQQGRPVFATAGAVGDIARVIRPAPGSQDLYIGLQERGILRMTAARPESAPAFAVGWKWGQINDLLPDGPSAAWIVTENGWLIHAAQRRNGNPFRPVLQLDRKITGIAADPAGNLWLTTGSGLTMVTDRYLKRITPVGFSMQQLSAVACAGNDGIWYTQGNALWYYDRDDGSARMVWRSSVPVNCLYSDHRNRLWIGTSGKGVVCREPDGRMTAPDGVPALSDAHILSIAGKDARVWVSSLNGVEELELDPEGQVVHARHHGKRSGIGSDYVYRIFIDRKGRTWFATDGAGITMRDSSGRYRQWNARNGIASDVAYSVTEDAAGNIWATTLEAGIFCFRDTAWQLYKRSAGLLDATAFAIAANRSGQVFITSSRGIDAWYPGDGEFRHINRRSGLGIDSVSTAINAAASDAAGNVYIPYQKGLLVFTGQPENFRIRPSVRLTGIGLFFRNISRSAHDFSYDQNHLTFRFDGVNYAHGERLRYRYRLEGFNNDWIQTTDESVTYPRLPPGRYRFCIQASLQDSFRQPASDTYAFTVHAPFWRRWWFWALLAAACAGIIYAGLRWRVRSLQKVAQLRHERMVFEYEHLKSQVNPHFLFNSLNTLAGLIEEDPETAVHYTVQLSDLYRDTLSFHEQEQISLAEEWNVLERYFYIQRSRFGAALRLEADVPEDLRARKKIVPLALQLLAENAVKHNVVSRSAPLVLFIEADEQRLTVRNAIRPKATREQSTGIGLRNIRQRYALLTDRPVTWTVRDNEFIVTLPLL